MASTFILIIFVVRSNIYFLNLRFYRLQMSETPFKDDLPPRPGSPAASEEPSFGGDGGGDIDFDVDTSGQQFHVDVGLSLDTTTSSSPGGRRRSNLGDLELSGLAEEEEEKEEDATAKKRKPTTTAGRKRMKKRRKIVIDNNQTELSSEHMKAMLRDTSDTVLQNVPHLASWPRDDVEDDANGYVGICPALQKLPTERLLARPCIGDDGGLAPELLALWGRNMCKITGKAGTRLPFRMRSSKGQRDVASAKHVTTEEEEEAEEEDDEDVERVRSQQTRDSIDGHKLNAEEGDIEFGGRDEDIDFGNDDKQEDEYNADMETPFDIQDEFGTVEYKADDLAEDDEVSVRSDRSRFSLGAVNDLEKELYEIGDEATGGEDRQLAGEELASHNSKWHKHTVRVLGMLKRNMQSNDGDDDEDEPKELSYNKLIAGCSRRTASGVFFEMLQLKTWDFIELEQNKSYGDITITPGLRFDEGPPTAVDA